MKKVKAKVATKIKKIAKKGTSKKKTAQKKMPEATDFEQVRKNIAGMVRKSAKAIATKVIELAKTGQLAPAKYLFEAVGLYPPTAETMAPRTEDSLAYTLLKRMGLPTEPVIWEEDPTPATPTMLPVKRAIDKSERESGHDQETEAELEEPDDTFDEAKSERIP